MCARPIMNLDSNIATITDEVCLNTILNNISENDEDDSVAQHSRLVQQFTSRLAGLSTKLSSDLFVVARERHGSKRQLIPVANTFEAMDFKIDAQPVLSRPASRQISLRPGSRSGSDSPGGEERPRNSTSSLSGLSPRPSSRPSSRSGGSLGDSFSKESAIRLGKVQYAVRGLTAEGGSTPLMQEGDVLIVMNAEEPGPSYTVDLDGVLASVPRDSIILIDDSEIPPTPRSGSGSGSVSPSVHQRASLRASPLPLDQLRSGTQSSSFSVSEKSETPPPPSAPLQPLSRDAYGSLKSIESYNTSQDGSEEQTRGNDNREDVFSEQGTSGNILDGDSPTRIQDFPSRMGRIRRDVVGTAAQNEIPFSSGEIVFVKNADDAYDSYVVDVDGEEVYLPVNSVEILSMAQIARMNDPTSSPLSSPRLEEPQSSSPGPITKVTTQPVNYTGKLERRNSTRFAPEATVFREEREPAYSASSPQQQETKLPLPEATNSQPVPILRRSEASPEPRASSQSPPKHKRISVQHLEEEKPVSKLRGIFQSAPPVPSNPPPVRRGPLLRTNSDQSPRLLASSEISSNVPRLGPTPEPQQKEQPSPKSVRESVTERDYENSLNIMQATERADNLSLLSNPLRGDFDKDSVLQLTQPRQQRPPSTGLPLDILLQQQHQQQQPELTSTSDTFSSFTNRPASRPGSTRSFTGLSAGGGTALESEIQPRLLTDRDVYTTSSQQHQQQLVSSAAAAVLTEERRKSLRDYTQPSLGSRTMGESQTEGAAEIQRQKLLVSDRPPSTQSIPKPYGGWRDMETETDPYLDREEITPTPPAEPISNRSSAKYPLLERLSRAFPSTNSVGTQRSEMVTRGQQSEQLSLVENGAKFENEDNLAPIPLLSRRLNFSLDDSVPVPSSLTSSRTFATSEIGLQSDDLRSSSRPSSHASAPLPLSSSLSDTSSSGIGSPRRSSYISRGEQYEPPLDSLTSLSVSTRISRGQQFDDSIPSHPHPPPSNAPPARDLSGTAPTLQSQTETSYLENPLLQFRNTTTSGDNDNLPVGHAFHQLEKSPLMRPNRTSIGSTPTPPVLSLTPAEQILSFLSTKKSQQQQQSEEPVIKRRDLHSSASATDFEELIRRSRNFPSADISDRAQQSASVPPRLTAAEQILLLVNKERQEDEYARARRRLTEAGNTPLLQSKSQSVYDTMNSRALLRRTLDTSNDTPSPSSTVGFRALDSSPIASPIASPLHPNLSPRNNNSLPYGSSPTQPESVIQRRMTLDNVFASTPSQASFNGLRQEVPLQHVSDLAYDTHRAAKLTAVDKREQYLHSLIETTTTNTTAVAPPPRPLRPPPGSRSLESAAVQDFSSRNSLFPSTSTASRFMSVGSLESATPINPLARVHPHLDNINEASNLGRPVGLSAAERSPFLPLSVQHHQQFSSTAPLGPSQSQSENVSAPRGGAETPVNPPMAPPPVWLELHDNESLLLQELDGMRKELSNEVMLRLSLEHLMAQERLAMQKDVERLQHENSWLADRSVAPNSGPFSPSQLPRVEFSSTRPKATRSEPESTAIVSNLNVFADNSILVDEPHPSDVSTASSGGREENVVDIHSIAQSDEELSLCMSLLQYKEQVSQYERRLSDLVNDSMRFLCNNVNVKYVTSLHEIRVQEFTHARRDRDRERKNNADLKRKLESRPVSALSGQEAAFLRSEQAQAEYQSLVQRADQLADTIMLSNLHELSPDMLVLRAILTKIARENESLQQVQAASVRVLSKLQSMR